MREILDKFSMQKMQFAFQTINFLGFILNRLRANIIEQQNLQFLLSLLEANFKLLQYIKLISITRKFRLKFRLCLVQKSSDYQ